MAFKCIILIISFLFLLLFFIFWKYNVKFDLIVRDPLALVFI